MRYLFGFLCVCALVGNLPLSASAQTGEEGTISEPNLHEPAPEEPALQLKLDAAGVEVTPSPSRTEDGYTLEELELRVKRAKIGLGVSGVAFFAGVTMGFVAMANFESCAFSLVECPEYPDWVGPVGWTGFTLAVGGLAGMAVSGVLLRKRKAHYRRPRRTQWDLAQSRLVF